MKKDVLALSNLKLSDKRPSKETLNHPGLVKLASGTDPFRNTGEAYLKAYESLGIDFINRVPEENAPVPLKPGETLDTGEGYTKSYLGIYDTISKYRYAYETVEAFWNEKEIRLDKNSSSFNKALDKDSIQRKMKITGNIGLYFTALYTTLFMWGVEYLGWEVFMLAAAEDPEGFKEKFLDRAFERSLEIIKMLCIIDSPFVFCHDDLADAKGPVFNPSWYDRYIFPRYEQLWKPIREAGKKLIFIADGNMAPFLNKLKETGVDGVMLENPATDFDKILKVFSDRIVIGGIETGILTLGTPDSIRKHVYDVHKKTSGMPGFAMSTPGGIHGNIPLENLEAYFDARVDVGYTPEGWRKS